MPKPNNHVHIYTLWVILAVLTIISAVIWFGATSRSHVEHIQEHWQNDSKAAADETYFYNRIHYNFGYGGFIHNFKNFILHQDLSLIPYIDDNINNTYLAIYNYRAITDLPSEREAIDAFRNVVDEYVEKYQLAKQLVGQGLDPQSIDKQVKVDDAPALHALNLLAVSTRSHAQVIEETVDKEVGDALAFFHLGWLLIPLLVLGGAIIIIMLHRLVKGTLKLQQTQQYINDIIQAAPDPLLVVDQSGNILHSNIEAQRLFGYSQLELSQVGLNQLIPQRFRGNHSSYIHNAFTNNSTRPMLQSPQLVALNKQGVEIPVEISLSYTRHGEQIQAITAIRDITERRKFEERLRLMSRVLDEASEGILVIDRERKIVDMNKAFCLQMGYQRDELLAQDPAILLSGHRHDESFFDDLWKVATKFRHWKGEIWGRQKGGELVVSLVTISAVDNENGEPSHYVAIFADISQLKEKEQHLEELAHFDQLTGLPNRMLCHDRLRASMHRAHRSHSSAALLYIDLDGFKQVNDRLGHEAGDEVLIKVGQNLKHVIREDDTAARLGGDEFVVILNEVEDCHHAEELVQRVLDAVTFQVESEQEALPISASIGVALYPDHGDDIERLMNCADKAMYYCKEHGKQGYRCFSEHMAKASGDAL